MEQSPTLVFWPGEFHGLAKNIHPEYIKNFYNSIRRKFSGEKKKPTGKDLNRHLTEEDVQMSNKHMRRCSTSLVIREMQIKNIMRFYYTTIGTATKKNKVNTHTHTHTYIQEIPGLGRCPGEGKGHLL